MKNNKWLRITLMALLALVILAGAVGAGYRLGLTQNPEVIKQFAAMRAERLNQMQKQNPGQQQPQGNDNNPHMQGFDPQRGKPGHGFDPRARFDRGFDHGRGGFPPFFGFFHLIVLGVLAWFGYKYVKNSGWKLVREAQAAPVAKETASVEENQPEV